MTEVESRIEQVTVYAVGARVRRVASVGTSGEGLPARVRVVGLPHGVIDDTVRAEVIGPGIAASIRVGVDAPDPARAAAEEPAELVAARRRAAIAAGEVSRLEAALVAVDEAPIVGDDPSEDPPAPWPKVVAARRGLVAVHAERELALRRAMIEARREASDAARALAVEVERDRARTTARGARLHELRKYAEVELTGAGEITLAIEYRVGAARWAPSYVARLDGDAARVEVRAVVAQRTGEDWAGAALRLSTAEPEQFAELPELHPQRIGRRQDAPARSGFRAPPSGAESLFADYDRAAPPPSHAAPAPEPMPSDFGAESEVTRFGSMPLPDTALPRLQGEVWDEESSRAKEAFQTPPFGSMAPSPAMPPPQAQMASRVMMKGRRMSARGGGGMFEMKKMDASANALDEGGGGGAPAAATVPAPLVPRLDYAGLRMAAADARSRGRLVAASGYAFELEMARAASDEIHALFALALPRGCHAEWSHAYDYAFAADGVVDVDSDGAWHALAITTGTAAIKLRHVAVPREQADVFRVASIKNPHAAPLLPGPMDVYDRGTFLVTTEVAFTPPGATLEVGLGVDPAVKIARNADYHEETTGMLRGALRLVHAITVDVDNLSSRALDLEVRERVPVAAEGDDTVEVTVGRVEPPWERWTPDPDAPREAWLRGTYRWKLGVPAGAKKTMKFGYEVKIATKHELVGGNRRDS